MIKTTIRRLLHGGFLMYTIRPDKHRKNDVTGNKNEMKGVLKTIMKIGGKFLHGTRGKPGRSAHGDKYY